MKKFLENIILAVILSFIIGFTCFLFGQVLIILSNLAFELFPYNLLILPFVGLLTVSIKNKNRAELDQSMKQVFNFTKIEGSLSKLILPFQIIMTWLAHISGASVGREGVALQLGATIGNNFSNMFDVDKKLFTSAGKAAGFSALFGTPLAALFFVFELNKKKVSDLEFWYITIIMVYCSSFFASIFGLSHFHQEVEGIANIDFIIVLKIIISAIIFIIVGNLFVYVLNIQKKVYAKIFKNELVRVFLLSILYVIVMVIVDGRYMSLGTNLIDMSFVSPSPILEYDFLLKMFFTTYILSLGYQGGEVTPLFSMGATLGVVLGRVFGLPVALMAALGYSVVFASATNAYLAGFFIALEIFGANTLPYIALMIGIAYLFKNNNGIYNNGVYTYKKFIG